MKVPLRRHARIVLIAIARRITPDGGRFETTCGNCKNVNFFFSRESSAIPKNGRGRIPETTGVGGTPESPGKKSTIDRRSYKRVVRSLRSSQVLRVASYVSDFTKEKSFLLEKFFRKSEVLDVFDNA